MPRSARLPVPARLLLLAPALLLGGAAAKPSALAPNLAVLKQDALPLCYDAAVFVNDRQDAALEKRAEARIAALLTDLKLKASEFDTARFCDRVLSLTFDMDNATAPSLYNADFVLETLNAYDESVDLKIAVIWNVGRWGGDAAKYSADQVTRQLDAVLNVFVQAFREDFTSLR